MTRHSARFARAPRRASRPLAAPAVFAALAALAACTDVPQPTAPARPGRPGFIQVATGPVVTSTADPGDGTCDDASTGDGCTLREAIAFADPGAAITFAPSVTGTITLTQGELSIGKALTVSGPGAKSLAVNGNQASRVFHITEGAAVTLAGLTVTGGISDAGGGIWNVNGILTVLRCAVVGNTSTNDGAGIHNLKGGLIVVQSTVSGNTARDAGGGIFTTTSNDFSTTTATVLNSTISGNTATHGGGVYNINGLTRVLHSTVTANQAPDGGGLMSDGDEFTRTDVQGSLVAGNFADAAGTTPSDVQTIDYDVVTRFRSLGYNVVGAAGVNVDFGQEFNATGDQTGVTDPAALKLGALADNGGPTQTHAVLSGSVALDKGDPAFDPTVFAPPLTADQRGPGFERVVNGRIDVGAFERQQAKLTQTITFPPITPNPATVSGSATLGATASSGLAASYSSLTPSVCTVTGNTVRYVGVGTCTVTANQAGNIDYAAATTVTQAVKVAYRFDGFLGSVQNGGVLNVAKAGQVIPLQWRLTDATGAPVTTLTTVQITATDLNCALGATGRQVAEQVAGGSGLQNLGNGYYQYNWKSPASYAKSCKTLQLDLGEGTGAHTARFAFSK